MIYKHLSCLRYLIKIENSESHEFLSTVLYVGVGNRGGVQQ